MELKAGYKTTDAGTIPDDWDCKKIGELITDGIIEKPLDGNHGSIHPKSTDFVDSGIPFVMANNIQGGQIDLDNCHFITKQQADSLLKGFAQTGDILITHKATIGNTAIVGQISSPYIMLTPQVTYYRIANATKIFGPYLKHAFDSHSFQKSIHALSGGGTRAYIGITAQHQLAIAFPPTKTEQQSIASALSDADELIESLEQLLAKKRNLKQGTMQELLTGKRRLAGFSGKWPKKTVAELERSGSIALSRGKVISKKDISNDPGDFPIYSSSVQNDGLFGFYGKFMFNEELITWSVDGGGHFFYRPKHKFSVTNVCGFMRVHADINCAFLARQLQHQHSTKIFDYQTKAHPSVVRKEYAVFLPPLEEQDAIAELFTDMDADITALENQLAKARQIKQGMMQELLTGRIRLV